MPHKKALMLEAAILYYEKKLTQQEIARQMDLTRQTVSKLLAEAVEANVVEISIRDPQTECDKLEADVCKKFHIPQCVVCSVSNHNEALRLTMTIRAASAYLQPLFLQGGQRIALSWGRTIQELIRQMPDLHTRRNTVFPLFGATDHECAYFSSNELARSMADRIGATAKYAWFPYLPDSSTDSELILGLSYYKKMRELWQTADIAIVGIGNTEILDIFSKTFGYGKHHSKAIGDVATHFFDEKGNFLDLYPHSLCAGVEDLKKTRQTVAIACGDYKASAIAGALRTGLIDTLITDEYTARSVLEYC